MLQVVESAVAPLPLFRSGRTLRGETGSRTIHAAPTRPLPWRLSATQA
jgi:hypothetical protein